MAIEFPAPACDGLEAEVVRRAVAQRLFGTEAGPVCIGRYEIVEQLGAGGTGIVYAARDPTLDRSVAIKVLNHHIPASQRSRLSTEARVLAQVVHPNVVAVYDVDLDYIVMERVDGLDLAQWLASPRRWPEILDVFVQAGRGLEAAHARGLVHRDFKPSNVLVGADGRARVVDFGVAVGGTPAYSAPEQLVGEPATAAADQYSFCVALRRSLEGRAPPRIDRALARGSSLRAEDRFEAMGPLLDALQPSVRPAWRRRVITLGIVTVTLAVAVAVWPRSRARGCGGGLEGIWDAPRRAEVRAAMLGVEAPFAETAWAQVDAQLTHYANAWAVRSVRACVVHDSDPERACLAERRRALAVVTEVLAAADRTTVTHSQTLVAGLEDLDACRDGGRRFGPPSDPHAADRARDAVQRAKAQTDAGHPKRGLVIAREALRTARTLSYPPILAEAAYTAGTLTALAGEPRDAEPLLHESYFAALACGDDRIAGLSAAALGDLVGPLLRRSTVATRWVRHAKAAAARAGDPDVERQIAHLEGRLAFMRTDYAAAGRHFERCRMLATGRALEVAACLTGLADTAAAVDDRPGAMAHSVAALSTLQRLLGPEHPRVAAAHSAAASACHDNRRLDEAVRHYRSAAAIYRRVLGPRAPKVAFALGSEAGVHLDANRPRAAVERLVEAREIVVVSFGDDHPLLAALATNRATAHRLLDEPGPALRAIDEALAIQEATMPRNANTGAMLLARASTLLELDRADEALTSAHAGRDLVAAALGPAHHETRRAAIVIGEALLSLGRAAEALRVLEPAVGALDDTDRKPWAKAQVTLALALTAAGREAPRARALMEAAAAAFGELGAAAGPEHASATAWLRTHG